MLVWLWRFAIIKQYTIYTVKLSQDWHEAGDVTVTRNRLPEIESDASKMRIKVELWSGSKPALQLSWCCVITGSARTALEEISPSNMHSLEARSPVVERVGEGNPDVARGGEERMGLRRMSNHQFLRWIASSPTHGTAQRAARCIRRGWQFAHSVKYGRDTAVVGLCPIGKPVPGGASQNCIIPIIFEARGSPWGWGGSWEFTAYYEGNK